MGKFVPLVPRGAAGGEGPGPEPEREPAPSPAAGRPRPRPRGDPAIAAARAERSEAFSSLLQKPAATRPASERGEFRRMVEGAGVRSGGAAAARSAPTGRDGELSTGDAGDAPGAEAPPAIDEGPAVDTAAAATAAAAAAAAALEAATAAATAAREAAEIEAERLAEVRAAFEAEVERARAFAEALEAAQSKLVREIRGEVAQIVLAAARAIAGEALHADPLLLDAMVSTAVEAFGRDGLVVRVAPADAPGVRLRHPELEVREDATLEAGMVATGPAGSLDASFGRATTAIEDALARWREGA